MKESEGDPYVRMFLVSKDGGQSYCTSRDLIEYGASNFIIDEIIKWGTYTILTETHQSYILCGECSFNIAENNGLPDTLYPVTGGRFSLRVFLPSH